MMDRISKIGVGPNEEFQVSALGEDGEDAWEEMKSQRTGFLQVMAHFHLC